MSVRNVLYVLAITFATAAMSADNGTSGSSDTAPPKVPPQATCVNHCEAAEGRCSRQVRSARQGCERVAANGGRNVFTGRYDAYAIDYGRFCSYFANPSAACGYDYYTRSCQSSLVVRHGICLDAMENIAALRYDCFRTERDANLQCRAELADCKAACR